MNKNIKLGKIAKEIEDCRICKINTSGKAVPGEGNQEAKVILIGEAPGANEAKTGRPFIGRAGKFLDKVLQKNGIDRNSFFITSPVKYFPGRRAPNTKEIEHGMTHLKKQVDVIKPKLFVLMGKTAFLAFFPEKKDVKLRDYVGKRYKEKFFITYHPSAGMRFTKIGNKIYEDFASIKDISEKI